MPNLNSLKIHTMSATEILLLDIGRNDPCLCNSKRKFKKCCGPVYQSRKAHLSKIGFTLTRSCRMK